MNSAMAAFCEVEVGILLSTEKGQKTGMLYSARDARINDGAASEATLMSVSFRRAIHANTRCSVDKLVRD